MGFFAIIKESSDNPFVVSDCHINFWSLSGFLARRFYWDTGLRLTNTSSAPLKRFQVALPFGTERNALSDLHDVILNTKVAELLFSRSVNVGAGDTLEYRPELGPIKVGIVAPTDATRDETRSGRDYSLWTLTLATEVQPGGQTYVRFRFAVSNTGRLWNWKRWGVSRFGAVVDARIMDYREAWNVKDGASLKSRMMPVENLNLFVIAPVKYQLKATSPSVHYLRILEGRAWETYLGRATSLLRREKLAIYQWRGDNLNQDKPFRAFLDISKEFGAVSPSNLALSLVVAFFVVTLSNYAAPKLPDTTLATWTWAWGLVKSHLVSVGIVSTLTFIFSLRNQVRVLHDTTTWVREKFRAIEDAIYRAKL